MPVQYRYDSETGCLCFRLSNHLNLEEFKEAITRAKADPDVPPYHLRFSNMRAVEGNPRAGDVEQIARLTDDLDAVKPPRRAVILAEQDVYFGLARMFRAHRGEQENVINICRDYSEAAAWLGLPKATPDLFAEAKDWR